MALNATGVPAGTGTIEIDLFPIIMQTIVAIVVSVGGGTYLGYQLSERSRTIQEKNEVQKVKNLLKNDFERINDLAITHIENMLGFIEQSHDDNFITNMMTSVVNVSNYALENIRYFDFVYWDVLSDSGHMIKLDEDNIKEIYAAHFSIAEATSRIEKNKNEDVVDLQKIIRIRARVNSEQSFRDRLKVSTHTILIEYQLVYDFIQNMDISWIDKRQLSPENKEKLDSLIAEYRREIEEGLRNA